MQKAFSLVELAIVIVILGLLAGGVLTGQSLIRASELRSVTVQYSNYISAVQAFRDKYFALPGDMTNAINFWGAMHATPATCRTAASTTTATCNGDGNGIIGTMDGFTTYSELWHFWKQLANAGLIEGSYNGVAGAGGVVDAIINTNVPPGKASNTGWTAFGLGNLVAGSWFTMDYGNALIIGTKITASYTHGPAFKNEETWNIDTKLDDGLPGSGNVISFPYTACSNAASATDYATTYKLTDTTAACAVVFRKAF